MIKVQTLPRKTHLLAVGEICNDIWFIMKGFARAYYTASDGEEITSWFMHEGDIIISVNSFYRQQASRENIQLLEESELVSLSYPLLQQLDKQFPEFNYVGRVLTEQYYLLSEDRSFSLRRHTAAERFIYLEKNYLEIFKRAPLKMIASYLGMTPETLSRMRKNATL